MNAAVTKGDLWIEIQGVDELFPLGTAQLRYRRFVDREMAYYLISGEPEGLKPGRYVFRFNTPDQENIDDWIWFAGYVDQQICTTPNFMTGINDVEARFTVEPISEAFTVTEISEWIEANRDVLNLTV